MYPNVLLIMVDSLRADQLLGHNRSCHTPFLDELSHRSIVFENAFSAASMTTCCTSSILTGTYPFIHGVRTLANHRLRQDIPTIAEAFKNQGYHTWAEVTGPLTSKSGLDRGFTEYRYREYTQWLDTPWGDQLIDKVNNDSSSPWFGFLHLWEIHYPRRITPEFNNSNYGDNLYERAVSSLDNQLGRLLEKQLDNTLIVLTSDHGEYISKKQGGDFVTGFKYPIAWVKRKLPQIKKWKRRLTTRIVKLLDRFGERDSDYYRAWLGHGFHIYDPLIHVPLLFYGCGSFKGGKRIHHLTSHVDIVPTLMSVVGLTKADTSFLSGIDLSNYFGEHEELIDDRLIYLEASGARMMSQPDQWLMGIRSKRYKYICGVTNKKIPEELYDLESDPGEKENIIARDSRIAESMRTQLLGMVNLAPGSGQDELIHYSKDELDQIKQRLRNLGYLD